MIADFDTLNHTLLITLLIYTKLKSPTKYSVLDFNQCITAN